MNEFLLNRSQGSIAPWTFQTAQCARLVQCLAPAPGIRFSSAPRPTVTDDGILNSDAFGVEDAIQDEVWAHKAGVNVLAIDHYEKRL